VGNHSWRRIYWSVPARNYNQVLWWSLSSFLPPHIHIFSGLQGKVSVCLSSGTKYIKVSRILIVGICNLGQCPCPRCLIPLTLALNMGMPRDMKQHLTLIRTDDARCYSHIQATQEAVYLNNYAIKSKAVEDLLHEESLVPAKVRSVFSFCQQIAVYWTTLH